MKNITVMFTACGSQFAPGIVKCFKNNGEREIRVIGGDMNDHPTNKYIVDAFYVLPPATAVNYVDEILAICKKEKVDILFPQMSSELVAIEEKLDLFKEIGTTVSISRGENLRIANNKAMLYQYMNERGIEVPPFKIARSIVEFERAVSALGYPEKPVCIKMAESSGSRGIRIIDSSKSLYDLFVHSKPESFHTTYEYMMRTLREAPVFPELLIMKCLPGNEYTVDLLADDGEVLYISGRNNTSMIMSIAQESVLQENQHAFEIAKKVVKELCLNGVIGMDFIFDENGVTQLMDINPRIDATITLFAAGGLNLPYLCIKRILGEDMPKIDIRYGTHLKRRYEEAFTDAHGALIEW